MKSLLKFKKISENSVKIIYKKIMKCEFFYETFSPKRLFSLNVYLFCMKIDENC